MNEFRAPQIYSEADTPRNLQAILARGLKIKCTKMQSEWGCLSLLCQVLPMGLWMKASLEASQNLFDEEPFEIHVTTQGFHNGPKAANLKASTNNLASNDQLTECMASSSSFISC
ncbi:hypothetical protein Rs2_41797 [Raphanus sativus]|nr:hypothetical protein Rs2_41797 [Raphanus sativus]